MLVPLILDSLKPEDDLLREAGLQVRPVAAPLPLPTAASPGAGTLSAMPRMCMNAEKSAPPRSTFPMCTTPVQSLESLITRGPEEAGPFVEPIVAACLVYIKHDPNYVADEVACARSGRPRARVPDRPLMDIKASARGAPPTAGLRVMAAWMWTRATTVTTTTTTTIGLWR